MTDLVQCGECGFEHAPSRLLGKRWGDAEQSIDSLDRVLEGGGAAGEALSKRERQVGCYSCVRGDACALTARRLNSAAHLAEHVFRKLRGECTERHVALVGIANRPNGVEGCPGLS